MTEKRKIKIPDGKGGWTELEGEVSPVANKVNPSKQDAALKAQFINEAAEITERLLQCDRSLILDKGLTKEHRAFAAALYCVNLRETYPGKDDVTVDPAGFDAIAQMAAEYYDANAPKKK